MITSDLGTQYTSNIWSQLSEMLHILYRQATAYHPESNGAVERLHRRLKDALCECAAAATWSKELPLVLLGLRAQPREDTDLSLAEEVFGAPIVLPNEFLHGDQFYVDAIVKHFSKTLDAPAFSSPRHNSSTQLLAELPDELLHVPAPPGKRLGGPATTNRVSFSDPLVSSPSSSQVLPSDSLGTNFLVEDRFFACAGPATPSQSPQQQ